MAVTNRGVWTPEQIDDYNLVADLGTMASTIDDALEDAANSYRGTSVQRNSFTSQAPEGTIWVDTNGDKAVWVKQGNSWQQIWPSLKGSIPGLPFAMAAGTVNIPGGSGSVTSATVSFPAGRFTENPVVHATAWSNAPHVLQEITTSLITPTGCTIWLVRSSSATTQVQWSALQMQSNSPYG